MKKTVFLLGALFVLLLAGSTFAETRCGVYFTKIGCPVCAKVDPVFLGEWIKGEDNMVLIEYVLDSWTGPDALLMGEYNLAHGTGSAVPLVIRDIGQSFAGIPAFYTSQDIFNRVDVFFEGADGACVLKDAEIQFDEINLNQLPAKPKIWAGNRLLVRAGEGEIDSAFLRELLFSENLNEVLAGSQYELKEVKAEPAPYSGGSIAFAQAIGIDGEWVLELRETIALPANVAPCVDCSNENGGNAVPAPDYTLVLAAAAMIIGLVAIIAFVKVKKK